MKISTIVLCIVLVGCASTPIEPLPEIDQDTQTAAAVANPALWRWVGKAVMTVLKNTTVQVKVENQQ
jgi:hypothetical protein